MVTRPVLVLLPLILALAGCGGGGSTAAVVRPGCGSSSPTGAMCVVSCNLGCTLGGCSLTDIAQNQPIILVFNQDVDPTSVSTASVSLRTATGEEPVGIYVVNGATVQFVPQIQVVGGASFFGFRANATYTLTLNRGPQLNAIRSTSGDVLPADFSCTLAVTRGVIDLDGAPPVAKLLSPSGTQNVDPQSTIALQFSEFIDATPFAGGAQNSPVKVTVARTRAAQGGGLECDPTSKVIDLPGNWQITNDPIGQTTTIVYSPLQAIPNSACVAVQVTTSVRDLAGNASRGQGYQFLTTAGTQQEKSLVEAFDNSLNFDRNASCGTWGGGVATPGAMGSDGLHGEFDPGDGTSAGSGLFLWSTDNQAIPANKTLSGSTEVVSDGVFRFQTLVLPRGQTARFRGKNPARIYVAGLVQIDGTLDLAGDSQPVPTGVLVAQPGGQPGAGGGAGGKGADPGNGISHLPNFDGANGEDVKVPATHAYANSAPGTGGRGSVEMPIDGASVTFFHLGGFLSAQIAAGGGGGGNFTAGETGRVVSTFGTNPTLDSGPPAAGGSAFPLFPQPGGTGVLDHFLVGGSGGGGAGTHPFLTPTSPRSFKAGGGGGGGGGALGLRVGGDLLVGASGTIDVSGGRTPNVSGSQVPYMVLGGGGGGGSLIVQASGRVVMGGQVLFGGGVGGSLTVTQTSGPPMVTQAGSGGDGVFRFELPGVPPADPTQWVGQTTPPAVAGNLGSLTETHPIVTQRSSWYRTRQLFEPVYARYEIDATIDGRNVKYSDDPNVGILAAGTEAVRFLIQGANEDVSGNIDPNTITGWRRYVGPFAPGGEVALFDDATVAYRFMLVFDRTAASQIAINQVTVFFQAF